MRQTQANSESNEADQGFRSNLTSGRERFLAHVIEHGFQIGRRSPEDFLRHFPPMAIMDALRDQPELRASIITFTTGTKRGIALKKSWESCGEDVRIALEEGETNAEAVLGPFALDDRVRCLDAKKLWSFITEGDFWKVSASKPREVEMARPHIAFMLERALQDKLLTHQDVVDGITVDELAARLPKSELGNIIKLALSNSHGEMAFTERDLLAAVPAQVLVNYIPLTHLWSTVIVQKIAERHSYVDPREEVIPATTANPAMVALSIRTGNQEMPMDLPAPAKASTKADDTAQEKLMSVVAKPLAMPAVVAAPQAAAEQVVGLPAMSSVGAKGSSREGAPQKPSVAKVEAPSEVALKVPAAKRAAANDTIDTTAWSAEVSESDIDEDTLIGEDLLVEVANS